MEVKEVTFKSSVEEITICCQECEDRLVAFCKYAESHVWHFFAGILLLPALGGVIAVWRKSIASGALGCLVMGVGMGTAIIKYPFVTPQTAKMLGMKNGILLPCWCWPVSACSFSAIVLSGHKKTPVTRSIGDRRPLHESPACCTKQLQEGSDVLLGG
jgi:hypothetical protein